ncbi:MAG: YnbE family lipoprotein [Croceibacterium sp.]
MGKRRALAGLMVVAGMIPAGCVSVSAPDKPIVIELNINISQEVIYRLADDVRQNIDKNPGIF